MSTQTMEAPTTTTAAKPTFLLALRGIWLLTWKSQLTWRRLPVGIVSLLVLPILVYITTSPVVWSQRHSLLGSPTQRLDEFARHLRTVPLRPHQRSQLLQVFTEEFARAEQASNEAALGETGP